MSVKGVSPWQSRGGWVQLAGLRSALARDNELHSKARLLHKSSLMLLCPPSSRSLCPALPRLTHLSFGHASPASLLFGSIRLSSESHYSWPAMNHRSNQLPYTISRAGKHPWAREINLINKWRNCVFLCVCRRAVIDPCVEVCKSFCSAGGPSCLPVIVSSLFHITAASRWKHTKFSIG